MRKKHVALITKNQWEIDKMETALSNTLRDIDELGISMQENLALMKKYSRVPKKIHPEQSMASSAYVERLHQKNQILKEQQRTLKEKAERFKQNLMRLRQSIRLLEKLSHKLDQKQKYENNRDQQNLLEDLMQARRHI